ncbi:hypothetical protein PTTG_01642 [Puccinia triticina 1-1 BBBD Race 1]|uniref:SUZ domain-containing protein n=2 Tax=Puccinia triticina TaxID=208348 RepID=A0A180GPC3_PUCT1|nr:hypothetical protein PTTG_01642 [Puccinia triticina 1-1 BBBD Race 1]
MTMATENLPPAEPSPLDQTLIEAINNGTTRDRQILLAAESEMGRFIGTNLQRQPLSSSLSNSLNSYQRMLVHRLGDAFAIKRTLESGQMYIERTPHSAWPTLRLETLIARQNPTTPPATTTADQPLAVSSPTTSSPSPPNPAPQGPPKTFKIMSRALARQPKMPSTASSASSTDCSLSESKRNEMSYEERQAAYLEARNRIFAATASSAETSTTGESTAGAPSRRPPPEPHQPLQKIIIRITPAPTQPHPHHPQQLKKNKTADSKLLAAKLRPSATSFDPRAKAHGYEEVTVIEVDDHSITLPYPSDPSSVYGPAAAYPAFPHHPHGFQPRDPRLGAFPPPAGPCPPATHRAPSLFGAPPFPDSSSSAPTMIGTVPLAPLHHLPLLHRPSPPNRPPFFNDAAGRPDPAPAFPRPADPPFGPNYLYQQQQAAGFGLPPRAPLHIPFLPKPPPPPQPDLAPAFTWPANNAPPPPHHHHHHHHQHPHQHPHQQPHHQLQHHPHQQLHQHQHQLPTRFPPADSQPPSSSDDDALRDPSADPASSSSSSSTTTAPIAAAVAHLTLASPGPPARSGPTSRQIRPPWIGPLGSGRAPPAAALGRPSATPATATGTATVTAIAPATGGVAGVPDGAASGPLPASSSS